MQFRVWVSKGFRVRFTSSLRLFSASSSSPFLFISFSLVCMGTMFFSASA
jgi:hypothetical protein